MTARELLLKLAQLPAHQLDLPLLVGTHYDNDTALTDEPELSIQTVQQIDGEFHYWGDPRDPGTFEAVTIT